MRKKTKRILLVAVMAIAVPVAYLAVMVRGGEIGPVAPGTGREIPSSPQPGMFSYVVYKTVDGTLVALAEVGPGGSVTPEHDEAILNISNHPDLFHVWDDARAYVIGEHWYVDLPTRTLRHR